MPAKKEKRYHFVQVILCEKCKQISDYPRPCSKCKNEVFIPVLKVQEI